MRAAIEWLVDAILNWIVGHWIAVVVIAVFAGGALAAAWKGARAGTKDTVWRTYDPKELSESETRWILLNILSELVFVRVFALVIVGLLGAILGTLLVLIW